MFTQALSDYYFGKNGEGRGFFGLRRDYKNFATIVEFSKVTYSTNGTKAVCYSSEVSDGEAGAGYIVFLEKRSKTWLVIGSEMIWIS
ncbi:hypothetical protein [Spirosoma fluminis]